MAHFAKLDKNNVVLEINTVDNEHLLDEDGVEREALGVAFLINWSNGYPYWKQTSYNGSFRKNYACVGGVYDEARNAFISPKPYSSWIFDEDSCLWEAPVPRPTDGKIYVWDEEQINWIEVTE